MNKKLLIGLGIAAVATTLIAIGVVHELKKMRKLNVDPDELDAPEAQKKDSDD